MRGCGTALLRRRRVRTWKRVFWGALHVDGDLRRQRRPLLHRHVAVRVEPVVRERGLRPVRRSGTGVLCRSDDMLQGTLVRRRLVPRGDVSAARLRDHQLATQLPLLHTWEELHWRPQEPQWLRLLRRSTSHPSDWVLLQFAKFALQLPIRQLPLLQVGDALARLHTFPQAPQWFTFDWMLISQPLATTPSQFLKFVLQLEMAQVPDEHEGVPFGVAQTIPQPPQWLTLFVVLISQPLLALPSQSPRPALQT